MRWPSFFGIAIALFTSSAYGNTPSLFFSESEIALINSKIATSSTIKSARIRHLLQLGSIVYVSPEDWAVWLQGEKWTPGSDRPNLHIIDVSPSCVRLSVMLENDSFPRTVTLLPHQSYNLVTGEISETPD